MLTKNILFVSHKKAQCGVYEFGKSLFEILQRSNHYKFIKAECSSLKELESAIASNKPVAIIYNYHPSVLPWITAKKTPHIFKNNTTSINIPQIGIIHEVTQQIADISTNYKNKFIVGDYAKLSNSLFDFYIAPDPTLLLQNPFVYKTGRLVSDYQNNFPLPQKTTIGSFGFGTPKKGFEKIVDLVQKEFDDAIIRFNIPFAEFGDKDGFNAKAIAEKCKSKISKSGIELIITHDFQDKKAMLDFLAQNTVNVFLYEDTGGRGLSSTIDNALAVKRPIAVSDSVMFRHLFDVKPSICVSNNSLKNIIENGFTPLQKHLEDYSEANILWEYERIVSSVLQRVANPTKVKMGIKRTIQSNIKRFFTLPDKTFTWLRNSDKATEDNLEINASIKYQPIALPQDFSLNTILDNKSREIYKPAIETLIKFVPKTMAKKIAEANVQQAFVFDTVNRYISKYANPKFLCVGSYEDTASMSLIKMGYKIEEIDPMLNYYLQEYFNKPSTKKNSYDIIFSTSVIEHDPDDESFIKCIYELLAPNGVAVITCDYKDGWKQGEPKPDVDARFYTQKDLKERLLSYMPNCTLVDEPQWDCLNPDFNYLGKYQYTFATFVVRKNN
jgi:SAM-dependent methyltransferase